MDSGLGNPSIQCCWGGSWADSGVDSGLEILQFSAAGVDSGWILVWIMGWKILQLSAARVDSGWILGWILG